MTTPRTASAFARAQSRLFHHGAGQAWLRGSVETVATLEHDVEAVGEQGQIVFYSRVAALPATVQPRVRDALVIAGEGSYTVDAILSNDGYEVRVALA